MLPLTGVRILAVEQYGAGPFGAMQLADMGAEVIKIENPAERGDVSRSVGPHFLGEHDSHFFQAFNRNKRSMTLNLRGQEGQCVLHDLAATADAVLDNLRGDQSPRLGVTYDQLKSANPRIVCAHLSAYGREGARASWPGYDYLMQAEAGYLSLTGEPDQAPARFGLSIVDMMAGVYAATVLLGGIVSARATGVGRDVDVSLFDTALANLNYLAAWYLNGGHAQGREPRGAHPSLTPSQLYRTADGWIFIMCNKQKFWPALCEKLSRPEWSNDPRFASFKVRLENCAELTRLLDAALAYAARRMARTLCRQRCRRHRCMMWRTRSDRSSSCRKIACGPMIIRGARSAWFPPAFRLPWRRIAASGCAGTRGGHRCGTEGTWLRRGQDRNAAGEWGDLIPLSLLSELRAVPASPCSIPARSPWSSDMA
jgi:crotonobetainyl-CoA:carnitine CoA-transferase CaiB-like acyl-CoA transferase